MSRPSDADTASPTSSLPWAENMRVLVVDDEPHICDMLGRMLTRMGFDVSAVLDGHSALEKLIRESFDVVLLDVRMPEIGGLTVCRRLRAFSDVPVIMLSALDRSEDIIEGFNAGADDYIAKPVRILELQARIRATIRRTEPNWQDRNRRSVGNRTLFLNRETRRVLVDDRSVQLAPKEFAVLDYLIEHADHPIGKSELHRKVWGYYDVTRGNRVESIVRHLRMKLEQDPANPALIVTIRPAAYMYVSPVSPVSNR